MKSMERARPTRALLNARSCNVPLFVCLFLSHDHLIYRNVSTCMLNITRCSLTLFLIFNNRLWREMQTIDVLKYLSTPTPQVDMLRINSSLNLNQP